MPAINETHLSEYQSEILFLLIGENPLPNYVAAKLLTKPFTDGREDNRPFLVLVHSQDTADYARYLKTVLGNGSFRFFPIEVQASDYYNIEDQIKSHLESVNEEISVGLNYTGGTKAMAVHAYSAVKKLRPKAKFSYLDPRRKFMRFDENAPGADQWWIDLSDVNSKAFAMTKIILDQMLALHNWEKLKRKTDNPLTNLRYDEKDLTLANLPEFNGDMFEDYIFSLVSSLVADCHLHDVGMNFELSVPGENHISFFEIDVVAIRGYHLFAISCTLEGRPDSIGRKLRKAKLFEIAHRARQLAGAEARVSLISLANEEQTKLLERQLKHDKHIKVWGKADLRNLKTKLRSWFND